MQKHAGTCDVEARTSARWGDRSRTDPSLSHIAPAQRRVCPPAVESSGLAPASWGPRGCVCRGVTRRWGCSTSCTVVQLWPGESARGAFEPLGRRGARPLAGRAEWTLKRGARADDATGMRSWGTLPGFAALLLAASAGGTTLSTTIMASTEGTDLFRCDVTNLSETKTVTAHVELIDGGGTVHETGDLQIPRSRRARLPRTSCSSPVAGAASRSPAARTSSARRSSSSTERATPWLSKHTDCEARSADGHFMGGPG